MHYKKKKSGCLFIVFMAVVCALALKFGPSAIDSLTKKDADTAVSAASGPSIALTPQSSDIPVPIDTKDLRSPYAILVRLSDNAVLMRKQSDERIYPASLTKMMTAIVTIEDLPDL